MNRLCALLLCWLFFCPLLGLAGAQQPSAAPLAVRRQGLRTLNHQGSFQAAAYLPDGTLVLLFNAGDGVRLLKSDRDAATVLAESHQGARGDVGVALTVDTAGNIYVAGTAWSGTLTGTTGSAFPAAADASQNSFIAGFDRNLRPLFVSFLGAGRTSVSAIAATSDAIFVTGTTYSASFPITARAAQTGPTEQGSAFVQRYTTDGRTLIFSTLVGAADGATVPTSLAANAADQPYVVGTTTSATFPVVHALQASSPEAVTGFVSQLQSDGSALLFSTRIAGSGLSSIGLDRTDGSLWLTGNLSFQAFPIANAFEPIADLPYQSLLRLSADGQTLIDSVLLEPGTNSRITPAPDGTAWISGSLSTPLGDSLQSIGPGDAYLLHLTRADHVDQVLRFGGVATDNTRYASLTSALAAPALSPTEGTLTLAGTVQAVADPSLRPSQVFFMGLNAGSSALLTSSLLDLLPSVCDGAEACAGSAGLLAQVTPATQGALQLSWGDLPRFVLRNSSALPVTGLQWQSSAGAVSSICTSHLGPWGQCSGVASATAAQSFTAQASNAPTLTVSLPAAPAGNATLLFDRNEIDFGQVSATEAPITRSVQLTNLGSASQTFQSAPDNVPATAPYRVAESGSTCSGPPEAHVLAPGDTCSVDLSLTPGSQLQAGVTLALAWSFGARSLPITGFLQPSPLSVSTPAISFGLQPEGAIAQLPRFLYLSNASTQAIAHAPATLPSASPFAVGDDCPDLLQPHSVCALSITYSPSAEPAFDTATLALDGGLAIVLTGQAIGTPPEVSAAPPTNLLATPAFVQFASAVTTSSASEEIQRVEVRNTGPVTLHVDSSVLGDFALQNGCDQDLPAQGACVLALQFIPTQAGQREGVLTLSASDGSGIITVPLRGTGVSIIPGITADLDLGQTPAGEPNITWVQLAGSFPMLSAEVQGSGISVALLADWGGTHGDLPASAFQTRASAPCSSCWLALRFAPETAGQVQGSLRLQTTAESAEAPAERRTLHGTATSSAGLLLSPAAADFGAIPLGSSSGRISIALVHLLPGAPAVQLQSITADGDFAVVQETAAAACGTSLNPTASCRIQLTFSPTQLHRRSGTLTVVTDRGSISAALTGVGTPAAGLSVQPATLTLPSPGQPATAMLTNTSQTSIGLGALSIDSSAYQVSTLCQTLAPGQSCTAQVSLAPASSSDASVPASAVNLRIPFSSVDSNGQLQTATYIVPVQAPASLAGLGLTIFPASATFAPAATNQLGQTRQFTLTNTGTVPETIGLAVSRSFPQATPTGCQILQVGASCTLTIAFVPQTSGLLQGSVLATATPLGGGASLQSVAYLSGYGTSTALLDASPGRSPDAALQFGTVHSGEATPQTVTLTNTGDTPATIRRLVTSPPFSTVSNSCTTALAPGSTCTVALLYSPRYSLGADLLQTPRTDTGMLRIDSDAGTAPLSIYLQGTVTPTSAPSDPDRLPTLSLSQGALTFSNTLSGAISPEQLLTLTNTGSVPVEVSGLLLPPDFRAATDCATVQPGSTCSLHLTFAPGDQSAPLTLASLGILSTAAVSLESVTLVGSSFSSPWQVTPTALDFGPVPLGTSQDLSLALTNQTILPLSLDHLLAVGDFTIAASTCPLNGAPLAAGQSCQLSVHFMPSAQGPRSGTLTIDSGSSDATTIVSLTGVGVAGSLSISPAALSFGTVPLHSSALNTFMVSNTGGAAVTQLAFSTNGQDASDFSFVTHCPASLAPGSSCTVEVTFTPAGAGQRSSTLLLTSTDPQSPAHIALTGAGAEPAGFTLSLASGSSGVAAIGSGDSAVFPLTLKASGGFAGGVSLSCTAMAAAPHATCQLSSGTATLHGDTVSMSAQVDTQSGFSAAACSPWAALCTLPLLLLGRRRSVTRGAGWLACGLAFAALLAGTAGCGGGSGFTRSPYTPAGTYRYQVTAISAAQPSISTSVLLQVTVR